MRHLLGIFSAGLVLAVILTSCRQDPSADQPGVEPGATSDGNAGIDSFVEDAMQRMRIPGLAAAIVKGDSLVWAQGYGWADLDNQIPMSPDTLINVGSVSKTVTNAAVLRLWEDGRIDLDADVSAYLPFKVRHPDHPEEPITIRQLLTHTSSIADGSAYEESYACGDPAVTLGDWIEGYLVAGGAYHRPGESFLEAAPGEQFSYSNVGFGLLGHVVETVSGQPFSEYTQGHLFAPLGMAQTSWYLKEIDTAIHAVPYDHLKSGAEIENPLLEGVRAGDAAARTGHFANCLYSFYNYPDGLLRTSVRQLSRFLLAHMNGGVYEEARILRPETVEAIWETQFDRDRLGRKGYQGLTWYAREFETMGLIWGHSGGDPGISTYMLFRPADGVGVIVFANLATGLGQVAERLFEIAAEL